MDRPYPLASVLAPRRLVPAVLVAMAALVPAAPAPAAAAREIEPISPGSGALRPWSKPLRDAPRARPPARLARAQLRAAARNYFTPDGYAVRVATSDAYADTPGNRANIQSYVDFLGSRLHGSEMGRLGVFIGPLSEVQQICGEGALACYFPALEVMVLPGEDTPAGQAPLEYVLTHELGHHVARNRRNDPWPAIEWGTKRWASYEGVCAGVRARRYFPGNQGRRYAANPGEAFAEAYAHYHYRGAPWLFIPSLRPDTAALRAIERDVRAPWAPPAERSLAGSLAARRPLRDRPVSFTLDGSLDVRLAGPRSANFNLQIVVARRVVAQTRARGSRDTLRAAICGARRVIVRVRRVTGSGPFILRWRTPG
jgi:hypothetical protein